MWHEPIREELARLMLYQAFEVQEAEGVESIAVEFEPLPGKAIGYAYSRYWGHPSNRIVLDSTHAWTEQRIRNVVAHEAFHILLRISGHTAGLMSKSGNGRWLILSDQMRLLGLYNRLHPRADGPAGRWRP